MPINTIRYDFPRSTVPKIIVSAQVDFGGFQTQLIFGVQDHGLIVPISFIAGGADFSTNSPLKLPFKKSNILLQREPKGLYRVKVELDRAVYFRANPKDLVKNTLLRQPHQIGIVAAELFLRKLYEGLQENPKHIELESFGIKLKEQIEILEERSKSNTLEALDFSCYKVFGNTSEVIQPVWTRFRKWIIAAAIVFLIFKFGNRAYWNFFEPLMWLIGRFYLFITCKCDFD